MVQVTTAKGADIDDALLKARQALPSPTEPDPGVMAAFSVFRTNEEKLRAVIYCIARSGDKKLAQDLLDYNTAARGVRADELVETSDTSPSTKG